MPTLIDTDVAIHLRDGSAEVVQKIKHLNEAPLLSAVTWIEMENGAYSSLVERPLRQARWEAMKRTLQMVPFALAEAEAYSDLLKVVEYSKRKVSDRMTAVTALVGGHTLITMKGRDYGDIDGLKLVVWTSPTPHPSLAPQ